MECATNSGKRHSQRVAADRKLAEGHLLEEAREGGVSLEGEMMKCGDVRPVYVGDLGVLVVAQLPGNRFAAVHHRQKDSDPPRLSAREGRVCRARQQDAEQQSDDTTTQRKQLSHVATKYEVTVDEQGPARVISQQGRQKAGECKVRRCRFLRKPLRPIKLPGLNQLGLFDWLNIER